jgi:hypothetical protein
MTHKIAMRLAGLYKLSAPTKSASIFREAKRIYTVRSKIVHGEGMSASGAALKRNGQEIPVADAAIEHLRHALKTLIENPKYLDVARIDLELLLNEQP